MGQRSEFCVVDSKKYRYRGGEEGGAIYIVDDDVVPEFYIRVKLPIRQNTLSRLRKAAFYTMKRSS
jgi:hypothetical protein